MAEPLVRPIRRLLVANRGEIARRVMRTAHAMGISTVAVFSEPDRGAPHVREADDAVALGGPAAGESYLRLDKLLDAARRTGCDALHPGYGFLSESADLARACADAGIVFVGPPPEAMEAMARKTDAKATASAAGVPVLPGAPVDPAAPDEAGRVAAGVGYPVLVKASAGGGGKGMHVVSRPGELAGILRTASREAASAFGDGSLLVERALAAPRHVEVQVFGDAHGNTVHLFERECSVQRRHQKVVEEAPSPAISPALRARMTSAAVELARVIDYRNAGTVEFLVDGDEFFFLEMNTRLQVEHPVTEAVTGLDLVRLQLLVAAGAPLPFAQDDVRVAGHAVEVRLYAEVPSRGYLPSFGRLHRYVPAPGVRVDDGVAPGSEVTTHYDPMLAKVVAHAPTRQEAALCLARALDAYVVEGVETNRELLAAVLRSPDFLAGDTTTDFLDRHPELVAAGPGRELVRLHAVAAALGAAVRRHAASASAFASVGWRNVRAHPQEVTFERGGEDVRVAYRFGRDGDAVVEIDGVEERFTGVRVDGEEVSFEREGLLHRFDVAEVDGTVHVRGAGGASALGLVPRFRAAGAALAAGGATAPVPGRVVTVEVAPGDAVRAGDTLVVVEAMKMEHAIAAPADCVVTAVLVSPGDTVSAHQPLVTLAAAGD